MNTAVGQTLIHPFHGATEVVGTTSRAVRGTTIDYLQLQSLANGLTISVPLDRVEEIGLRPVASRTRVDEIFAMLRDRTPSEKTSWSRRFKDLQTRVSSGRIEDSCYIIREIVNTGSKAPASAEGQLLRSALSTLGTELALALEVTQEAAIAQIVAAATPPPASEQAS